MGNREVEYQQAVSYIQHMYDTRHQIFQFAITLMARRSQRYLAVLEAYAMELEQSLGFGLIGTPAARMPRGIDSTVYLHLISWTLVLVWIGLSVYYGGLVLQH